MKLNPTTPMQKTCTNPVCDGVMHRCFTGKVFTSKPPQNETIWVCLDCKHTMRGSHYTPKWQNSSEQESVIKKLKEINPLYLFMSMPLSDDMGDNDD